MGGGGGGGGGWREGKIISFVIMAGLLLLGCFNCIIV